MASVPYQSEHLADCPAEIAGNDRVDGEAAHGPPAELPLFRFGLRQLFWFVTGLSALLGLMTIAGGMVALGLLVAVLIVAGHIGSTVLGSRLRAHADERLAWRSEGKSLVPGKPPRDQPAVTARLATSPLHERRRVLGSLPLLIAAGLIIGGVMGAVLLELTTSHSTSPAGILVGATSFSVLGGWIAFLAGNFYGIARSVWRQARTEIRKDRDGLPGNQELNR